MSYFPTDKNETVQLCGLTCLAARVSGRIRGCDASPHGG